MFETGSQLASGGFGVCRFLYHLFLLHHEGSTGLQPRRVGSACRSGVPVLVCGGVAGAHHPEVLPVRPSPP